MVSTWRLLVSHHGMLNACHRRSACDCPPRCSARSMRSSTRSVRDARRGDQVRHRADRRRRTPRAHRPRHRRGVRAPPPGGRSRRGVGDVPGTGGRWRARATRRLVGSSSRDFDRHARTSCSRGVERSRRCDVCWSRPSRRRCAISSTEVSPVSTRGFPSRAWRRSTTSRPCRRSESTAWAPSPRRANTRSARRLAQRRRSADGRLAAGAAAGRVGAPAFEGMTPMSVSRTGAGRATADSTPLWVSSRRRHLAAVRRTLPPCPAIAPPAVP